ncbi:patatin family protein [uncultured Umboniibacter sp.]|uniref:patatin-like phospholipase family protein n=1 Tax=uncultured Umboniibacter sp. TaxID=1798917 RepID=UPI002607E777|nr:patatin family protein [uncultured Umboniibacter sp.]
MSNFYQFDLHRISEIYRTLPNKAKTVKPALVLEGGGQRTIFSAGVVDAFMDHQFAPFIQVLGVSGGAHVGTTYAMDRMGMAKRIIEEVSTSDRFYRRLNWFRAAPVMDLDWYFDVTQADPAYRLDASELPNTDMQLQFMATHAESFSPRRFHHDDHDLALLLKASSAIPYFYDNGVEIQGHQFVDGGLGHPIPAREVVEQGANYVVVIRVSPKEREPEPIFSRGIHQFFKRTNANPRIGSMMDTHQANYQRDEQYIQQPPAGVTIVQLAPHRALDSIVLGSSREALIKDYKLGYETGVLFVNTWGAELVRGINGAQRQSVA